MAVAACAYDVERVEGNRYADHALLERGHDAGDVVGCLAFEAEEREEGRDFGCVCLAACGVRDCVGGLLVREVLVTEELLEVGPHGTGGGAWGGTAGGRVAVDGAECGGTGKGEGRVEGRCGRHGLGGKVSGVGDETWPVRRTMREGMKERGDRRVERFD